MTDSVRRAQFIKPTRRGTSLLEMVVVMGIATVMLGLAVTMIHLMLQAERSSTKTLWYGTSLARFSRTLRQDVHAATSADIPSPPPGGVARLELTLPKQRTVSFQIDRGAVTRTQSEAGEVRHRDVFYFPRDSAIRFERTREPDLVRVVINRPPKPVTRTDPAEGRSTAPRSGSRVLHIEAALARDYRFARRDR